MARLQSQMMMAMEERLHSALHRRNLGVAGRPTPTGGDPSDEPEEEPEEEPSAKCARRELQLPMWLVIVEYKDAIRSKSSALELPCQRQLERGPRRMAAVGADSERQAIIRVMLENPENSPVLRLLAKSWPDVGRMPNDRMWTLFAAL